MLFGVRVFRRVLCWQCQPCLPRHGPGTRQGRWYQTCASPDYRCTSTETVLFRDSAWTGGEDTFHREAHFHDSTPHVDSASCTEPKYWGKQPGCSGSLLAWTSASLNIPSNSVASSLSLHATPFFVRPLLVVGSLSNVVWGTFSVSFVTSTCRSVCSLVAWRWHDIWLQWGTNWCADLLNPDGQVFTSVRPTLKRTRPKKNDVLGDRPAKRRHIKMDTTTLHLAPRSQYQAKRATQATTTDEKMR